VNVDLAGGTSLNDSILDATDFDNIVFDDDVDVMKVMMKMVMKMMMEMIMKILEMISLED